MRIVGIEKNHVALGGGVDVRFRTFDIGPVESLDLDLTVGRGLHTIGAIMQGCFSTLALEGCSVHPQPSFIPRINEWRFIDEALQDVLCHSCHVIVEIVVCQTRGPGNGASRTRLIPPWSFKTPGYDWS